MRFGTAFITTAFLLTALTTTVSAFPVSAPQGTHHAPKAASPPPLACPPARTCPPTSALANHSSLVLLPRPAAARHDPHAPAARCAATNAPPPRYAPLPCALLATMQHASKTVDCIVDYRVPLGGSRRRRAGSSQRQRGSGPKGARHRGRMGAYGQAGTDIWDVRSITLWARGSQSR